jgi:hypothetical protein
MEKKLYSWSNLLSSMESQWLQDTKNALDFPQKPRSSANSKEKKKKRPDWIFISKPQLVWDRPFCWIFPNSMTSKLQLSSKWVTATKLFVPERTTILGRVILLFHCWRANLCSKLPRILQTPKSDHLHFYSLICGCTGGQHRIFTGTRADKYGCQDY